MAVMCNVRMSVIVYSLCNLICCSTLSDLKSALQAFCSLTVFRSYILETGAQPGIPEGFVALDIVDKVLYEKISVCVVCYLVNNYALYSDLRS